MTEVTPSELKLLYTEIIIVAIIGVFLFFYNLSPIDQTYSGNGQVSSGNGTSTPSSIPWSTQLVDSTLGLPVGTSAILIVSSILLIPMTIMNGLVLARLAKDFLTQWV
jgi:hypothetical protein